MPVLNWIGKEAVVKHHRQVPFRLLEPVPELSCVPVQKPAREQGRNTQVEGYALTNVRASATEETAFLGTYKDRAVFLLYNGILKDKTNIGGNVLNSRTLEYINSLLPDFDGERVIYGARSRFDKTKLAKLGITFHQLPYDLAVKTWF